MADIGMIKGRACLEALLKSTHRQGVVVLGGCVNLEVYQREEGEETVNIKHTNATQMHDMKLSGAGTTRENLIHRTLVV